MSTRSVAQMLESQLLRYQAWLKSRPQHGADLEVLFKWLSYYLAGQEESRISPLSELVYSVSRLLSLLNHLLVRSPAGRLTLPEVSGARLRTALSVLEYIEVFIELAAARLFGPTGRWVAIVSIQVIKTCWRLVLLYGRRCGMLVSRPLDAVEPETDGSSAAGQDPTEKVVVLPSSGRRVRSVFTNVSPSVRPWAAPPAPPSAPRPKLELEGRHLAAETLHVLRPIGHLAAIGATGYSSWPAWLLPLAMDVASLQLYSDVRPERLSTAERQEVSARRLQLLLYLLRSPFYDRFTRRRLAAALSTLARTLPLGRYLIQPVADYLPTWQSTFFYIW